MSAKIQDLNESKKTSLDSASLVLTPSTTHLYLNEQSSDVVYTEELTLNLNSASSQRIDIQLSTEDVYATKDVDYQLISNQVTILPGEKLAKVPIKIFADSVGEGVESFKINLSSQDPTLSFSSSQIIVEINDDDPIVLSVLPLYPNFGSNFFDLVQNQKTTPLPLVADVACDYSGTKSYDVCLDGGYYKKVVAVGQHSCLNLTLEDGLGVFDWKCNSTSDPVFFYSRGLKAGKGLKDLLDASAFKNNFVTLKLSGASIASSASLAWWTNSVTPLALNSGGSDPRISLSSAGTFYTVPNSGASRGISLVSAKVGLVILNGAVFTSTATSSGDCQIGVVGTQQCLVSIEQGADFSYIEGDFQATSNLDSVFGFNTPMGSAYMVRMHNMNVVGVGVNSGIDTEDTDINGFSLTSSKFSNFGAALLLWSIGNRKLIKDVVLFNNQTPIVEAGVSWFSSFINIKLINNSAGGFSAIGWYSYMQNIQSINNVSSDGVDMMGNYSIAKNILTVGNSIGMSIDAQRGVVNAVTSLGNNAEGFTYTNSASSFVGSSDLLSANNLKGIKIGVNGSKFNNISLTDNNTGIEFVSSSSGSVYGEKLLLGNSTDCLYTSVGASPGLTGASCDNQGASTASRTLGLTASSYFLGRVTSESTNVHTTGSAVANAITDWLNFASPFRIWANESVGSIISAPRNACTGVSGCRIWDLRLKSTATNVYNVNGVFINQSPCPASIQGDVVDIYLAVPHLRHATEIFGDRVGNDNGLCESGEECIYSPHIGYYQGEGDYTQNTCVFQNGVTSNAVTNVKMYAYPQ